MKAVTLIHLFSAFEVYWQQFCCRPWSVRDRIVLKRLSEHVFTWTTEALQARRLILAIPLDTVTIICQETPAVIIAMQVTAVPGVFHYLVAHIIKPWVQVGIDDLTDTVRGVV
ncbi:hypothetical protein TNCT_580371 [Trichonephila clavata]|uniref:Uncharacterized protein n=1 Tax=Trichonephila clavata TaxID=2740835 RepID=A0A8X6LVU8_TRICU|nr:hypothetical protein TNCT_580371 [Trichonephila clavata]